MTYKYINSEYLQFNKPFSFTQIKMSNSQSFPAICPFCQVFLAVSPAVLAKHQRADNCLENYVDTEFEAPEPVVPFIQQASSSNMSISIDGNQSPRSLMSMSVDGGHSPTIDDMDFSIGGVSRPADNESIVPTSEREERKKIIKIRVYCQFLPV